jgi:hypothetical protein
MDSGPMGIGRAEGLPGTQHQAGAADPDLVAGCERSRLRDASAVDERAVEGAEIVNAPHATDQLDHGVQAGRVLVGDDDVVLIRG